MPARDINNVLADFEVHVKKMGLDGYWKNLRKCGWLSDIPKEEHQNLKDRLKERFDEEPMTLYLALVIVNFNEQYIQEPGDYENIIRTIGEESFGKFRPVNIEEEIAEENLQAKIKFEMDGRIYSTTVKYVEIVQSKELLAILNRALDDSGVEQRFFPLPVNGVRYVLISEETYKRALKMGLIPEVDEFYLY